MWLCSALLILKICPSQFNIPFLPTPSNRLSGVTQSCPSLCNSMNCSLPGSSAHGIFQERLLEWAAISFSRGSSQPRDRTQVFSIADRHFTIWATHLTCAGVEQLCKCMPTYHIIQYIKAINQANHQIKYIIFSWQIYLNHNLTGQVSSLDFLHPSDFCIRDNFQPLAQSLSLFFPL